MISIHEKDSQILGECRTGVIIDENLAKLEATVSALKHGCCFITNGPQLLINAFALRTYKMGESFKGNSVTIRLDFLSSEEFGKTGIIKVYCGIIGDLEEKLFTEISINENAFTHDVEILVKKDMYVRAKFEGNSYRGKRIALTNPIWIKPT